MIKKLAFLLLLAIPGLTSFVFASPSGVDKPGVNTKVLPRLQCDRFHCDLDTSGNDIAMLSSRAEADPNPNVVGPPSGQRFNWRGAGYPACQALTTLPVPTAGNPYEYVKVETLAVPLGSTHANLMAIAQVNLSGGPIGSGGVVGFLQIRRSGTSPWLNSANAYLYTVSGDTAPLSLYGTSTLWGLENLAALPNGSGVPEAIDVRLAVFPAYAGGFSPGYSAVCQGKLEVTF